MFLDKTLKENIYNDNQPSIFYTILISATYYISENLT